MHPSSATKDRITPRIVSLITTVIEAGWQGVRQCIVATKHRRDVLRLADYDDHLLADIGLTRNDVSSALRQPCWCDPTASLANYLAEPPRAGSDKGTGNADRVMHGNASGPGHSTHIR